MSAVNLTGMDCITGKALSGEAHLAQSIADIIATPLGSRVMRRDYGSMLFELVDRPLNRATALLASMAVAMALARWEPRITVAKVTLSGALSVGKAIVEIDATRVDDTATALTRFSIPLR